MNSTLTPAAEKFMSFEVRAHCAAETGFRLAVTAGSCSGLSVDIGVARASGSGEQVGERNDLNSLYAEGRPLVGGVTIVLTDTAAQTGLIFPEAGVLLEQGHKGRPLEEESCRWTWT
ncbi:iron-sulfur cluster assembly accessory protein [Bradyrhizobium sp. 170]|uniref:iron-sulfur cluster assembly accessory protein n=1 Tax=Bradyrhizobium sp. 170 TaxID=2782641 RepID=UPI001FFE3C54|nr:iron-sulfur cluster assembly accessory protein [Bradyrhizobium sp. 170]